MHPILIIPAGIIIFVLLLGIGTAVNWHLNPDEYAAYLARTEAEDRSKQAEEQSKRAQERREQAYEESAKRIEKEIEEQKKREQEERWNEVEKAADVWVKKSDRFAYDERCDMWVYPALGCPP